ncbi:hypothetical protein RE474_09630 [Methanolobus sediminis]|uniref:Uncharacterized protein n=1 Tax=Methanolobus sediminis TaxID=3072978 RepID=A0AA51UJ61_9EURY|nr:hypothetical protein [Methanolobus sediminis]WMW24349.1 hypothetical protein RE474_09630 [Methanolobus sediminis]
MQNSYNTAVEHSFLKYRLLIQEAGITEEQRKELLNLVDQAENKKPAKLSNLKKLDKYEKAVNLLESKFKEYAGNEAHEELCQAIDEIYNTCSCGLNLENMKLKLASVINRGGSCQN